MSGSKLPWIRIYCKQGHMIEYTSWTPGGACLSTVNNDSSFAVRVRVAARAAGEGSGAVLFQANTAHKAEE